MYIFPAILMPCKDIRKFSPDERFPTTKKEQPLEGSAGKSQVSPRVSAAWAVQYEVLSQSCSAAQLSVSSMVKACRCKRQLFNSGAKCYNSWKKGLLVWVKRICC